MQELTDGRGASGAGGRQVPVNWPKVSQEHPIMRLFTTG